MDALIKEKLFADGLTPLHVASKGNCSKIVKILLNRGACVNASDKDGLTPLHVASKENRPENVETLLKHGARVNSTISLTSTQNIRKGYTPLHYAVEIDSQEVTKLLLKYNADVNVMAGCETPLYMATKAAHQTTVELLLEHGADVDVPNENGKTALRCAVENGYSGIIEEILKFHPDLDNESNNSSLNYAIKRPARKYKKIVEILYENGFRVNPIYTNDRVLLHSAVKYGYLMIVRDLLHYGANVNMRSTRDEYHTLLHTAAICLQEEVAELLINCGANVNAKDRYKKTPIFYAIQNLHLKITKLLLVNGANIKDHVYLLNTAVNKGSREIIEIFLQCNFHIDVYRRDQFENTACEYQKQTAYERLDIITNTNYCPRKGIKPYIARFEKDLTPLHISANRGRVKITRMLLNIGIMVNAKRNDGTTALHVAAGRGHVKVVKILLENGAAVNSKDCDHNTPLHLATINGDLEVIETLIQFGAEVDLIYSDGETPLHVAVYMGHAKLVKMLLDNGATVNSKTHNDNTPLHFAAQNGDLEVVETLIRFGAEVNLIDWDKKTPLHVAADMGHAEVVKMLLENGATVNSKDSDGNTPLHLAALDGRLEVAETLIRFGAEVDLIDLRGNTALLNACLTRNKFLIIFLLQNGSDINMCKQIALDYIFPYRGSKVPNHVIMENAKIIVRHLAKLKAENLFVRKTHLKTIRSTPELEEHYLGCEREIIEMKKRKISNSRLSFCDFFLMKDEHQLEIYTRNESIVEVFESNEYLKVFPLHADVLEYQLKKGQERQCLLKSGLSSCNSLFRAELPYFFMNKMFSYLSSLDLRNLIYARPCDIYDDESWDSL